MVRFGQAQQVTVPSDLETSIQIPPRRFGGSPELQQKALIEQQRRERLRKSPSRLQVETNIQETKQKITQLEKKEQYLKTGIAGMRKRGLPTAGAEGELRGTIEARQELKKTLSPLAQTKKDVGRLLLAGRESDAKQLAIQSEEIEIADRVDKFIREREIQARNIGVAQRITGRRVARVKSVEKKIGKPISKITVEEAETLTPILRKQLGIKIIERKVPVPEEVTKPSEIKLIKEYKIDLNKLEKEKRFFERGTRKDIIPSSPEEVYLPGTVFGEIKDVIKGPSGEDIVVWDVKTVKVDTKFGEPMIRPATTEEVKLLQQRQKVVTIPKERTIIEEIYGKTKGIIYEKTESTKEITIPLSFKKDISLKDIEKIIAEGIIKTEPKGLFETKEERQARAEFKAGVFEEVFSTTYGEVAIDIGTYGVAKAAGFGVRAGTKLSVKIVGKVAKYVKGEKAVVIGEKIGLGLAKTTVLVGGTALTVPYTIIKTKEITEAESSKELGRITGGAIKEIILIERGLKHGARLFDLAMAKWRTKGDIKIPTTKVVAPEYLFEGQKYPRIRRGQTAAELKAEFYEPILPEEFISRGKKRTIQEDYARFSFYSQLKYKEKAIYPKEHAYPHAKEVGEKIQKLIKAYPEYKPYWKETYGSVKGAEKEMTKAMWHDIMKISSDSEKVGETHGEAFYKLWKKKKLPPELQEIKPQIAEAIRKHDKPISKISSPEIKFLQTADILELERFGIKVKKLPLPEAREKLAKVRGFKFKYKLPKYTKEMEKYRELFLKKYIIKKGKIFLLEEMKVPRGFTASPREFAKVTKIKRGTSEIPVLFSAPKLSPTFFGITGEKPTKLLGWGTGYADISEPTAIRLTFKKFVYAPGIKALTRGPTGRYQKKFFEDIKGTGITALPFAKSEKEAGTVFGTPIRLFRKKYYFKLKDFPISIKEYMIIDTDLTNIPKGAKVEKLSDVIASSSRKDLQSFYVSPTTLGVSGVSYQRRVSRRRAISSAVSSSARSLSSLISSFSKGSSGASMKYSKTPTSLPRSYEYPKPYRPSKPPLPPSYPTYRPPIKPPAPPVTAIPPFIWKTKAKPKKRKKRYKYEDTVALVQSFTAKELKLPPLKIPRSKLPKAIPMFQTIGIRRLPKIVA